MIAIEWLDQPTAAELSPVAALLSDWWREVIPGEPDIPAAELSAEVNDSPDHHEVAIAVARAGCEVVGTAQLLIEHLRGRESLATLDHFVVAPAHRRSRLGRTLLDAVSARTLAAGRKRLSGYTSTADPAASAFAASTGAETGLVDQQNRAAVADVDRELLQAWVSRVSQRAAGYELVCLDGVVPDELLAPLAELTHVMNTAPHRDSLEDLIVSPEQARERQQALADQGWTIWTVCAQAPGGELVGFTELAFAPHRPWLAFQGDTGVLPAHRGRGLGRWLKATTALRMLAERPEVSHIETFNAGVNAPMLGINRAMGFRTVAEWQEWELTL
ncbi:MAG TPA: GNAT family N-acetyltransferase [Mycobacteriales bacterium]|nr:GNAT family N-acetyltransferase [Mycobacteriales bacterium]